jgi:hypothetical protein
MENKVENLELIVNLSEDSRAKIESLNRQLIEKAGAILLVDEVTLHSVKVAVKNINGKRVSKYDLMQHAYKAFSENIPTNYRILIKL